MKVSCKYCGGTHERGYVCPSKPTKVKRVTHIEKFRSGRQWRNKAKEIKKRDNFLCLYCLIHENKLNYKELSVHHITSLKRNFNLRLEDENLITLCRTHHDEADASEIDYKYLEEIISKVAEEGFRYPPINHRG